MSKKTIALAAMSALTAALFCSAAHAVRDPALSMGELRARHADTLRQIAASKDKSKQAGLSAQQRADLMEEQQRLQKQEAELKKSIALSEQVQRQEAVTYATGASRP